jgi:hypothetical protein
MVNNFRLFLLIATYLIIATAAVAAPDNESAKSAAPTSVTAAQAREDISYLISTVEDSHPDLYYRATREDYGKAGKGLQQKYAVARGDIKTVSLYRDIAAFLGVIHDGHTSCSLPLSSDNARMPFAAKLVGGRLFVDRLLDDSMHVSTGDEITAVNGIPALKYLDGMTKYRSYEVYGRALVSVVNSFSSRGSHENEDLKLLLKKRDGTIYTAKAVWENVTDKYGMLNPYQPFSFSYLDGINAGYMRWDTFFDRRVCGFYARHGILARMGMQVDQSKVPDFEDFLHDVFDELERRNTPYLIVDLRENSGGSSLLGNNFISFLTDEKIKDYGGYIKLSSLLKKTHGDTYEKLFARYPPGSKVTDEQQKELMGEEASIPEFELRKNPQQKYKGKVILLTGYATYSAAETFTVLMKDNGLAAVAGEPTGNGGNGPIDSLLFSLPNSRINARVSFSFQTRPSGNQEKEVSPDIRIIPTAEDYLAGRDTVLETVKRMIVDKKI